MGFYLLLGVVLLGLILLAAQGFVRVSPAHLAQGFRAFIAAFTMLASTGLLLSGRFGLAMITIAATVMAIRALRAGRGAGQGAGWGAFGAAPPGGRSSEVTTEMLQMQLDHATGELEGEVLKGRFMGRDLASLGLSDLFELLAECQREDPRSVALLETYLDRREPDWRTHLGAEDATDGGAHAAADTEGPMDEATAASILGLAPEASAAEIKAAHRRLMTKLHPDHGGSSYLAAQLNQAKDYLLRQAQRHRKR
jgi:hypothetical protein